MCRSDNGSIKTKVKGSEYVYSDDKYFKFLIVPFPILHIKRKLAILGFFFAKFFWRNILSNPQYVRPFFLKFQFGGHFIALGQGISKMFSFFLKYSRIFLEYSDNKAWDPL